MSPLVQAARPRGAASTPRYDAVVVGAGPYGLSTAAHLLGRGLRVAAFGKPLELWREHMPKGMCLRSHWWASNLSDPAGAYAFERFFAQSGHTPRHPLPIEIFIEYGLWFQRHAVPCLDETYVSSIRHLTDRFLVTLEDGRTVESAAVVIAPGLAYYAHRPPAYAGLPSALVSHSSALDDPGRFAGRRVIVVGGGQSAVESAALLHEGGADVHLVCRRPIDWLGRDRTDERGLLERIAAPTAGIADGWVNWGLEHLPYLFHRLPASIKDRRMRTYYAATAAEWLKARTLGKVTFHEGQTPVKVETVDGGVEVRLSGGQTLRADHVLLATGYKVDVRRLTMIDPSLQAQIRTADALPGVNAAGSGTAPVLSADFESSMPGLYFVGATSMRTFGPLYRFVVGCGAASARVSRAVARASRRSPLSV